MDLTQRVEGLEQDTAQIKVDLAFLTVRSESFATKADLAELRTEMHQEMGGLRKDMQQGIGGLYKEIASQTRWLIATVIGVAALCMTAAKLLF